MSSVKGSLEDKLIVGMSIDEIIQLLGEPTNSNEGSNILKGRGTIIASKSTISRLNRTLYCFWDRPEAEYYLKLVDGKLADVNDVLPPKPI